MGTGWNLQGTPAEAEGKPIPLRQLLFEREGPGGARRGAAGNLGERRKGRRGPWLSPAPHGLVPRTRAVAPPSQSPVSPEWRLGLAQDAEGSWVVCVRAKSLGRVRLFTARQLLCPRGSPGKNVRVGCVPSPRDLPDPGIQLTPLTAPAWAGLVSITRAPWEARGW